MLQAKPVIDKQKLAEEAAELSRQFKPAAQNFLRRGEGIGAGAVLPKSPEKNLGPFSRSQKDNSQSPKPEKKVADYIKDNFDDNIDKGDQLLGFVDNTKQLKPILHTQKFNDSLDPMGPYA